MSLIGRIFHVQERIKKACTKANRNPSDIQIVAVTKQVGVQEVLDLKTIGVHHFGENRVQNALDKVAMTGDAAVWHFIGTLQRKKAKDVVKRFTYLHSLDRYSLATELDKQCKKHNTSLNCFIQVNVSGEETKCGITPYELHDFYYELKSYCTLNVIGLMTMAPKVKDPEEVRSVFKELKRLQIELKDTTCSQLSMGMSSDFEIAIEEGATWIRLGSVLFGGKDKA